MGDSRFFFFSKKFLPAVFVMTGYASFCSVKPPVEVAGGVSVFQVARLLNDPYNTLTAYVAPYGKVMKAGLFWGGLLALYNARGNYGLFLKIMAGAKALQIANAGLRWAGRKTAAERAADARELSQNIEMEKKKIADTEKAGLELRKARIAKNKAKLAALQERQPQTKAMVGEIEALKQQINQDEEIVSKHEVSLVQQGVGAARRALGSAAWSVWSRFFGGST